MAGRFDGDQAEEAQPAARAKDLLDRDAVQQALHALRYGKSLKGAHLLELDLVAERLREDGLGDSQASREWCLGRIFAELVGEALEQLRGPLPRGLPSWTDRAPEEALKDLDGDFRSGSLTREAWGSLLIRYLIDMEHPVARAEAVTGQGQRMLHRRVQRGLDLLTARMRELELEASQQREERALPLADRIVVRAGAGPRQTERLRRRLQEVVRAERGLLRVDEGQLRALSGAPASQLDDYLLSRIAAWSRPRDRMDERFVRLSVLLDRGEDAAGGRWRSDEREMLDLREALDVADAPAAVLLGPPGSGKSTLLRHLEMERAAAALRAPDEDLALPFLVSLNHYGGEASAPPPAPWDWLSGHWARRQPDLPPLARFAERGELLLLLDGLNEMPCAHASEYRARIRDWRRLLQRLAPGGNRLVFSCRSLDYSAPLSSAALPVPQIRLQPMTDEQVEDFLHRYAPRRAEQLWSTLSGSELLEALRWPFFLRLLAEGRGSEDVPLEASMAALFTRFVRMGLRREVELDHRLFQPGPLLHERDYDRIVRGSSWSTPFELPRRGALLPRLEALALDMQAGGAESGAPRYRASAEQTLMGLGGDGLAESVLQAGIDLGVLDEDPASGAMAFRHQLFQEYFVARGLVGAPRPKALARPWRSDEQAPPLDTLLAELPPAEVLPSLPQTGWEEPTLLALAMAGANTESMLRQIQAWNLSFAGRCAARAELRDRLGDEMLTELRAELLARSRDPAADVRDRIACGEALGQLGDPRLTRREGPHGPYLLPELVRLPAGSYPIGVDEDLSLPLTGIDYAKEDHRPRHRVDIASLRIARFPVSNAEYGCFLAAGGYEDERWWDTPDGRSWRRGELARTGPKRNNRMWRVRFLQHPGSFDEAVEEGMIPEGEKAERWRAWLRMDDAAFERALDAHWTAQRRREPSKWRDSRFSSPAQPVVGLSWYEARAYACWLSAQSGLSFRLPREVEWEAAAAGQEGRVHPWGAGWDPLRANTIETHLRAPAPIGVFPRGDTPEGIADMAGNVFEWCSTIYGESGSEDGLPTRTFGYPYRADDGREDALASPAQTRVVRSGGWASTRIHCRCVIRNDPHPDEGDDDRGFRLVLDEPETTSKA